MRANRPQSSMGGAARPRPGSPGTGARAPGGLVASGLLTLAVACNGAGNQAPVFTGGPSELTVQACSEHSVLFTAEDPDGDALAFSSPDLPAGAALAPEPGGARLTWRPTALEMGDHDLLIRASDGRDPPLVAEFAFRLAVTAPPPASLALSPAAEIAVVGGEAAAVRVTVEPADCYEVAADVAPEGAVWDADEQTLSWATSPDDFGVHRVAFSAADGAQPPGVYTAEGRVVVQFLDDFSAFSAYALRDVNLDFCCQGPVVYELTGDPAGVLHSHTDLGIDVKGHAFRVFERSTVPIAGVAYELTARDTIVGPACGSGGVLQIFDFAVTDPAATWPNWETPEPIGIGVGVPDGPDFQTVSAAGQFAAPTTAVTVSLFHVDASNICTIDVFWDRVLLTPLGAPSP